MTSCARLAKHVAPGDCRSLAEVRQEIDALDREIVKLIALRFTYMTAAARIKESRDAVRDEVRKAEVIANAGWAARAMGLPGGLVEGIWETLVEASITHELDAWDEQHD